MTSEQNLAARGAGQGSIIVLNGASSSGKTTLARMLQEALQDPFLHLSSDQLVDGGAIPSRRDTTGPFGWPGAMRSRFFAGFHRCIPAMASAGNHLIVDHIIEYAAWRAQLATLLDGFDVLLVGVHCDLDELDRRERERADRRMGEGRTHVELNRIHDLGPYDAAVDTTRGVTTQQLDLLVSAWHGRRAPSVLTNSLR